MLVKVALRGEYCGPATQAERTAQRGQPCANPHDVRGCEERDCTRAAPWDCATALASSAARTGEDGGVGDGRAQVAERGRAKHRGDAVCKELGVVAANLLGERRDEGQDDAHRAKRGATPARDQRWSEGSGQCAARDAPHAGSRDERPTGTRRRGTHANERRPETMEMSAGSDHLGREEWSDRERKSAALASLTTSPSDHASSRTRMGASTSCRGAVRSTQAGSARWEGAQREGGAPSSPRARRPSPHRGRGPSERGRGPSK